MNTGNRGYAYRARSVGQLLREVTALLAELPHASPRLEAELLLGDATALERSALLAWPEMEIGNANLARFYELVRRRLTGEPIAYIRGRQAFWSLDLDISPDTLIPRPETELLVELALEMLPANEPLLALDAGSGSGAIAAALATERPAWTLIATDFSMGAARVARGNLRRHGLGNTGVIRCDWLAPVAERSLHALISNPPYVADGDPHLDRGDLRFEPRTALAAGPEGLDAIRVLSTQAASRLRPAGFIALEHGFDQGPATRSILAENGFVDIRTRRDLGGNERATSGFLAG